MARFQVAAIIGLIVVATANAGQIQIGGSSGLTSTYIGGGAGGFTEQNYQSVLFSGATGNAPVATTQTDSTNHVTFSLDSDGASGGNATEFWQGNSAGTPRNMITVPVNVYGVSDVWTMLNLDLGNVASRDDQFYFNWSNGTTLVVLLCSSGTNCSGGNAGAQPQVEDAILCATGSCPAGDFGPTSNGVPDIDTGATIPGFSTGNVTVDTNTVYSSAYTNAAGSFAGTSGTVVLSDQGFIFSGATLANSLNNTLVSVQVREQDTTAGYGVGLSAVTVDANAPEPSTLLLVLTGLGAIGISRLRRA